MSCCRRQPSYEATTFDCQSVSQTRTQSDLDRQNTPRFLAPISRCAPYPTVRAYRQAINASAVSTKGVRRYLSSDNDPLFEYHRWQVNLRILEIEEIKSVPYTQISHPFIERLIGTIRREYTEQTLFWNVVDLKRKLSDFESYYNHHRTHSSLGGDTPEKDAGAASELPINLDNFRWQPHLALSVACCGLSRNSPGTPLQEVIHEDLGRCKKSRRLQRQGSAHIRRARHRDRQRQNVDEPIR